MNSSLALEAITTNHEAMAVKNGRERGRAGGILCRSVTSSRPWVTGPDWCPPASTLRLRCPSSPAACASAGADAQICKHAGSEGGTTYRVLVRYRYEVAGKSYESQRAGCPRRVPTNGVIGRSDGFQTLHQAQQQGRLITVQ